MTETATSSSTKRRKRKGDSLRARYQKAVEDGRLPDPTETPPAKALAMASPTLEEPPSEAPKDPKADLKKEPEPVLKSEPTVPTVESETQANQQPTEPTSPPPSSESPQSLSLASIDPAPALTTFIQELTELTRHASQLKAEYRLLKDETFQKAVGHLDEIQEQEDRFEKQRLAFQKQIDLLEKQRLALRSSTLKTAFASSTVGGLVAAVLVLLLT